MMITTSSAVVWPSKIPEELEVLCVCDDPEWQMVQDIHDNQMRLVLFHTRGLTNANKVHFHAFCCGVVKRGIWELPHYGDIKAIGNCVVELLKEFKVDCLAERVILLEGAKLDENGRSYVFCQ